MVICWLAAKYNDTLFTKALLLPTQCPFPMAVSRKKRTSILQPPGFFHVVSYWTPVVIA
jgi:hypothetical protein